ncbi:hypothetical protein SD77_2125 [Bacillus badius]|uniref:Ribose 5-phosphate isomerase B n=1 Tax=Bacillus badius TaxID=1455 RepID=A0ABR5AY54_BACBA|nr:hypothetical protein SD77_2125 [Bacillus badius]
MEYMISLFYKRTRDSESRGKSIMEGRSGAACWKRGRVLVCGK